MSTPLEDQHLDLCVRMGMGMGIGMGIGDWDGDGDGDGDNGECRWRLWAGQ